VETFALCHGLSAVAVTNTDGRETFWVMPSKFLSECSFDSMEQLKEEAIKAGMLALECMKGPDGARHVFHTLLPGTMDALRMLQSIPQNKKEEVTVKNNRNIQVSVNPQYEAQQRALREICDELGVVYYLPDYHAMDGDNNTVLVYSKEAASFNEALDICEKDMGISIPSEKYRMHFFAFENTDANGLFDMSCANRGSINLRGDGKAALEAAIVDAWKKHVGDTSLERRYVAVVRQRATRDVQVCSSPDCDVSEEDTWEDWRSAEAYIGVFEGSESVAMAKAAAFAQLPPENIRLIPLVV